MACLPGSIASITWELVNAAPPETYWIRLGWGPAFWVLSGSPKLEKHCLDTYPRRRKFMGPTPVANAASAFTGHISITALRSPLVKESFSPSPSFPQTDLITRHLLREDGTTTD